MLSLAGGVFIIGLATVVQTASSWLPDLGGLTGQNKAGTIKTAQILDVKKANFDYLVPGKDDAWKYDAASPAFDQTSGVVKYVVKLNYSEVNVTVSQQKMPDDLKPKGSSKFTAFINNSNPTRSQPAGRGTIYFLAALENGAPANGADTIIYATDDILMFGKAGRVVGYEAWTKLLTTMKRH